MKIFKLSENYILDISQLLNASVEGKNITLMFKNNDTDFITFDDEDAAEEAFNNLYEYCNARSE